MSNVDQPPNSSAGSKIAAEASEIDTVVSGQKRLINSILGYLCSFIVMGISNVFLDLSSGEPVATSGFTVVMAIGLLMLFFSVVMASSGIFRMGRVLYPGLSRYLYAIGIWMPIPLVGLIVMLSANASATGFLRANGIKVGFLGAKR